MINVLVIIFFVTLSYALPQVSENFIDPNFVGIVNGQVVEPHSLPYQVGMFLLTKDGDIDSICSGSLVSNNYVLTAAHCLRGISKVKLMFGAHNILQKDEKGRIEQIVKSSNFIFYSIWPWKKYSNDIALIRLKQSVGQTEHIKIIQLASGNELYIDKIAIVAGWGDRDNNQKAFTDVLYYITNKIISNEDCKKTNDFYKRSVLQSNICLSGVGEYHDGMPTARTICNGDSGSPLVVDSVQVGILAWGQDYCKTMEPSVFTRVSKYYKWVQKIIRKKH